MRGPSRGAHSDARRGQNSPGRGRAPAPDRSKLAGLRVIQRDLVYVIGIPAEIAHEEQLARHEYFGQYGPIKKIAVNHQIAYAAHQRTPTVSAYVTFCSADDAWECLFALEGFALGGHAMRASFGTTKYCSSFLGGQARCANPDCTYLHAAGDPADSFEKDEIEQNSPRFAGLTRPPRPPDYLACPFRAQRPTRFPPRRAAAAPAGPPAAPAPPRAGDDAEPRAGAGDGAPALWNCTRVSAGPLTVDYVVGRSLAQQLELDGPSIRALYQGESAGSQ
jgi:hypothetical protein